MRELEDIVCVISFDSLCALTLHGLAQHLDKKMLPATTQQLQDVAPGICRLIMSLVIIKLLDVLQLTHHIKTSLSGHMMRNFTNKLGTERLSPL